MTTSRPSSRGIRSRPTSHSTLGVEASECASHQIPDERARSRNLFIDGPVRCGQADVDGDPCPPEPVRKHVAEACGRRQHAASPQSHLATLSTSSARASAASHTNLTVARLPGITGMAGSTPRSRRPSVANAKQLAS